MASMSAEPPANMNLASYHVDGSSAASKGVQQTQTPPLTNSEASSPENGVPPSSVTSKSAATPPALTTHALYQARKFRPPQEPLYIPAALRPTEPPVKFSPPKYGIKPMGKIHSCPPTPPHSAGGDGDNDQALQKLLNGELAKQYMTRIVTDEWKDLEDVSGVPTKDHWKPDTSAMTCDLASCPTTFNTFKRRHHCRRCGLVFCAPHTTHQVPLDQHARFHPNGLESRACDCCWEDYKTWAVLRKFRKGSASSSSKGSGSATPTAESAKQSQEDNTPIVSDASTFGDGKGRGSGEMAIGSPPRDFHWSTF